MNFCFVFTSETVLAIRTSAITKQRLIAQPEAPIAIIPKEMHAHAGKVLFGKKKLKS